MIRTALAVALSVSAAGALAETPLPTYQGLTLGAPLPDNVTSISRRPTSDGFDPDEIPAELRDSCTHQLSSSPDAGLDGDNALMAVTRGCDGPVIAITSSRAASFLTPLDSDQLTSASGLDGIEFGGTTLSEIRARLCSEGLIAPPHFGQDTATPLGTIDLAYELAGSDAIVVFAFRLGEFSLLAPTNDATAQDRDAAQLMSISLLQRSVFEATVQPPFEHSAGYQPLSDVFTTSTRVAAVCPLS